MISIDDFKKSELRVGKILSAERIEGSDKLLKLMVDLGVEPRQILAGIAQHYDPAELIGKQVIVVANLEPRIFRLPQDGSANDGEQSRTMLRGLESQGMILCADDNDGRPITLSPSREVPPGSLVK